MPKGWSLRLISGEYPVNGWAGLVIHAGSLELCTKSLRARLGNRCAGKMPGCAACASTFHWQALREPSSTTSGTCAAGLLHWLSNCWST
ncbi:hypothetical protein D3C75_1013790 [compost metagenome]